MTDLSADVDRIQWVVTGMDMTQTVVMPMVGWLGGILGKRNLFLTAISISLVGACLAGMAWSVETLIGLHWSRPTDYTVKRVHRVSRLADCPRVEV